MDTANSRGFASRPTSLSTKSPKRAKLGFASEVTFHPDIILQSTMEEFMEATIAKARASGATDKQIEAIGFYSDIEFDPLTHEVTRCPWEEILGRKFVRFGRQSGGARFFATYEDEFSGEIFQVRTSWQSWDSKKGKYSKPYLFATGADPLYTSVPETPANERVHVLTEGKDKACCASAHGYLATSLTGCHGGYRSQRNGVASVPYLSPKLVERLEQIDPDKTMMHVITFDQDDNPQTVETVRKASDKTGRLLTAAGYKVKVASWDSAQGKGLDDAVMSLPEDQRAQWMRDTIENAIDFADWQKSKRSEWLMRDLIRLNSNQVAPTRHTVGEYLPALEPLQPRTIDLIEAPTGAGKTTAIADLVKAKTDGFTIVFAPLNSLGLQVAETLGFPHASQYNKVDDREVEDFFNLVRSRRGIVLCPDSIGILTQVEWLMGSVDLVVIDEVNQVSANLATGGTTKGEQARVLQQFAEVLSQAIENGGSILAGEAEIYQRSVDYLKTLSGAESVRLFKHTRQGNQPWDIDLCEGSLSGFVGSLITELSQGKRILCPVTSQSTGEKLERIVSQSGFRCKILRVDSKTNDFGKLKGFFENPDKFLAEGQYDLVIYSPSSKSGVSITAPVFDSVWGILTSLDPDTWRQMVARYRLPVPRKLFTKPFVQPYGGNERLCSRKAVRRRLDMNLKAFAASHNIDLAESLIEAGDDAARLLAIETANADYIVAESTAIGIQKVLARSCFTNLMQLQGYRITEHHCTKDALVSDAWTALQEELDREKAAIIADLEQVTNDEGTAIGVRLRTLQNQYAEVVAGDKSENPEPRLPTWITNLLPQKLRCIEAAPGIDFDDPETCYRHLAKDFGRQYRGVELQALSENLEAAHSLEVGEVEAILKGYLKLPHKLPRNFVRAKLIKRTGVLSLLDGEEYSNTDPRAIAVKEAALKWAKEIYYWLGLNINADQTPVAIVNKLLGKLRLDPVSTSRPGTTGKRDRIYQIPGLPDPHRTALLEAMRRRLRQVSDDFDEATVADSLNMIRSTFDDSDTLIVIWQGLQSLPEPDLKEVWRRLTEPERSALSALSADQEVAA